jgi:hypothetical protein
MHLALEILGKRSDVDAASRKEKPAYIQELIDDALVKVPKLSMKREAT